MTETSTLAWQALKDHGSAAPSRRVTDAATRVMHALMGTTFLIAYLTAESETWRLLHATMGYTLAGLLAFRLGFGLLGPRHARLSVLWRRMVLTWGWLRMAVDWRQWRHNAWHQSPMMAVNATIALSMVLVIGLALTGYVVFQDMGPEWWVDAIGELHEMFTDLMVGGVLLHIGSVVVQSTLKSPGYWQRMWSGRIPGKGPDLVASNATVWAMAVVFGVLGFWLAVWTGWLTL